MSFPVAVQSAIFYIIACTPCAQVRHRHKTRQIAKKERREKARLETEQPGLYRHPSPFNTNPYWRNEISLGPSVSKKTASKNSSQRGLTSAGCESSVPSLSDDRTHVQASRTNVDSQSSVRENGDNDNDGHDDDDDDDDDDDEDDMPSDWNRKTGYQREDEELWGQWSGQKLKDAINKARDSAGRLIESTLGLEKEVTDLERRNFYTTPRNPPVNDYHPPVVSSKPPHNDAHKWMLQPPPPAKIMEGKVPVSRATSSGSKSSTRTMVADDPFLEKIVQDRLARERRARQSSGPTESELIESLFVTRSNQSLNRRRSLSFDGPDEPSCDKPYEKRRRPKPRPIIARPLSPTDGDDDEDDDGDDGDDSFVLATLSKPFSHAAQRPRLETIHSTDASSASNRDLTRKSRRTRSRRSKLKVAVGSPVGDDTE